MPASSSLLPIKTSSQLLECYGISPEYGFASYEPSLTTLPPYYILWEDISSSYHDLLRRRQLRRMIDTLPVLHTSNLVTEGEYRRAYVLLVFMLHGYVWEDNPPKEVIPPQITIPLFEICKRLELPPIATFAGVCLWNIKLLSSSSITEMELDLDNLACIQTFAGTSDEKYFYLISAAIEITGAPALPLMMQAIEAANMNSDMDHDTDIQNRGTVLGSLGGLCEILKKIISLLQSMHDRVDPEIFYHELRPYLAGSKNMAEAGLPNGLSYDDGYTLVHSELAGGSNAQSSLIQFIDIVLGVEHVGMDLEEEGSFSHQMRAYMPGSHRRFLEYVEKCGSLKDFIKVRREDEGLVEAYNECLGLVREMREKHIRVVARFVITPSCKSRKREESAARACSMTDLGSSEFAAGDNPETRGTGGTSVIPLLRQTKEETAMAVVG